MIIPLSWNPNQKKSSQQQQQPGGTRAEMLGHDGNLSTIVYN